MLMANGFDTALHELFRLAPEVPGWWGWQVGLSSVEVGRGTHQEPTPQNEPIMPGVRTGVTPAGCYASAITHQALETWSSAQRTPAHVPGSFNVVLGFCHGVLVARECVEVEVAFEVRLLEPEHELEGHVRVDRAEHQAILD